MGNVKLNEKPTAEDFAYAYAEDSTGATVRVPKEKIHTLETDDTLTQSGIPADAKAVGNKFGKLSQENAELKGDLDDYVKKNKYFDVVNLFDESDIVENEYISDKNESGSNTNYFHTKRDKKIFVSENDVIYFKSARYITAFNDETLVSGAGVNITGREQKNGKYIVPSGVNGIIITGFTSDLSDYYIYKNLPLTHSNISRYLYNAYSKNYVDDYSVTDDFSKEEIVRLPMSAIYRNKNYILNLSFDSFTYLIIGQGLNTDGGQYVVIDDTNVNFIRYMNGSERSYTVGVHGLNIANNISVIFNVDDNKVSTLRIASNGGIYENEIWSDTLAVVDTPFFKCGTRSNGSFRFTSSEYNKSIWIFGDSYVSLNAENRWIYHMEKLCGKVALVDGYAGRNSYYAFESFAESIDRGNPSIVIWAMGMNDKDSGSVNSKWKEYTEKVIAICKKRNIEVILCTIPCTPTVDNSYKNAYIKSTGCRYIDFAKSVNGESFGSTWFDDMLSNDNVHPSEKGAFALAMQAMIDVPEFTRLSKNN